MLEQRHPSEPFRIKSVESIELLPREQREKVLQRAKFNSFKIKAEEIYIDLLTDSGTGAMSKEQWAAVMLGDESYAGARSFFRFEKIVKEITSKEFILPTHQGRVAENVFFSTVLKKGDYVPNNTHFDTTGANVQHKNGYAINLPCPEAGLDDEIPFKGNMDTRKLESFIEEKTPEKVPVVFMTVTNNSAGGQAVSMANIKEASSICKKFGIRFFFDCARFAENAYFIKKYEPGFENKTIKEIAQEMFSYSDGALMSAKKDGLANMGGFIAVNDEELARQMTELLIVIEGFPTYGGMSGRDIEAVAAGLSEVLKEDYLAYRVGQMEYLGKILEQAGAPIIKPVGGHAIFIDAGKYLPHIPADQFPGQALVVELYREGGIRACEIGSIMFGGYDPNTGEKITAPRELVRLAVPRRVYTGSHLEYVARALERITARKDSLRGYKITRQATLLRHFTIELEEMSNEGVRVK
ncbi:MAG: tryptophanase [candidate division Zixibacteria bacterium]|nr:tryptophanase [candidate division Zixibacteria bacterium]